MRGGRVVAVDRPYRVKQADSEPVIVPIERTLEQVPIFGLLTLSVDGDLIVVVHGEIDVATAPQLWEHLAEVIPNVKHRLVLDLHDTAFMDSAALSVFVRAFKRLQHQ